MPFLCEKRHESTTKTPVENKKTSRFLIAAEKTRRINIQTKSAQNALILCDFSVFLAENLFVLLGNSCFLRQLGHSDKVHIRLFPKSVGPADTTVMKW